MLSGVLPLRHHDADGGPRRAHVWDTKGDLGRPCRRRHRLAAAGAADLTAVLTGMVLVGAGTFFAQAAATGFVSRAATTDRGSASGIYLASYFMGGLTGSAILGVVFDQFGWPACVAGIGLAIAAAAALTLRLEPRATAA